MISINQGLAAVTTGLEVAGAVSKIKNGLSNLKKDSNKSSTSDPASLPSLVKNPLEKFASYTPVWTLACLTPKQFNNPSLYRQNPSQLKHIVMSSAGRFDADRARTAYGVPEYYLNNFSMKAVVGGNQKTGNTNAFKFEFDIWEPYSMGLLLQSLQVAAQNAGYLNYLNNTPYVLRLDFMGWDEDGKPYTSIKPKFFVLGLSSCKFTVNEGGSTYKVEGVPFNHKGFSDLINTAFNDVKIALGPKGTVQELLAGTDNKESLVSVLNDIEKRLKDDKQILVPDIYDIQFPNSSNEFQSQTAVKGTKSTTVNPGATPKLTIEGTNVEAKSDFSENVIGQATLGFDQSKGGNFVMKKNDKRDEKTGLINRDKMTIDPKKRVFQFAQGQSLTSIITQVILSSDYAAKAIDPKNTVGGFIKWFRLDVQIELLDYDDWVGDFAKKITFRVVPFYIHQSVFDNPNSKPLAYPQIQKTIVKGYEYIYTGQNVDVLKFDININNLFYTGLNPSAEKDSGRASDPATSGGTAPQVNKRTETEKGKSAVGAAASGGRKRNKRSPDLIDQKIRGGDGGMTTERKVAESFQNAFTNMSAEMCTVNLEIIGDPYWIVDSGMANYFATPTVNTQITEDGTANYESGDCYVYLTFKTPVDINENTGLFDYPYQGKISPFSGIYRATAVESKFSEGTFKQNLTLVRMPGQAIEYADVPKEVLGDLKSDKASSGATTIKGPVPLPTSPQDDPGYNQVDNTGQAIY